MNNEITTDTYLELNDAFFNAVSELYHIPHGNLTNKVFESRAKINGIIAAAIRQMAHEVPEDKAREIIEKMNKELSNVYSS